MSHQPAEVFVPPPPNANETALPRTRLYLICVALASLASGFLIGRLADEVPGQPTLPPPATFVPLCWTPDAPAATLAPETGSTIWAVYVSGAVVRPGVVTVTAGSLVVDAINAAGGPAPGADLEAINLAVPLQNNQHIRVPALVTSNPPPASPQAQTNAPATPTTLININTADAATLTTLPRIGPAMAQRIIEYRQANGPFMTIADIQKVSGIGPSIFAAIEPYITVGP